MAWVNEHDPGEANDGVLAQAIREEHIVLTADRDHGDLLFHRGLPAPDSVIYFRLRLERGQGEEPAARVLELLQDGDELLGRFTTVGNGRPRFRTLP